MKYKFQIRNNATGVERLYDEDFDWMSLEQGKVSADEAEHYMLFQWGENNYACDCNRELFWLRAGGDPEPEEETLCGSDRFSIVWIEREDGSRIDLEGKDVPRETLS